MVCIDCSGSMADSVIHSAVMAGIFHAMPSLRVRLVAFDTNIVDLSEHVDDPVEVLMSVQLGGGTDIAKAMRYCLRLIEQPTRTIVVRVEPIFGAMNMCGNLGAAMCPLVVAWLVEQLGQWDLVLILFVGIYVAAAACWALLNPNGTLLESREPRVERPEPEK